MENRKLKVMGDSVICVTWGPFSKCQFMLLSKYQEWLKTIPQNERRCVLVTETNWSPADLDFINRSNEIIDRLENEKTEVEERITHYFKSKKRA